MIRLFRGALLGVLLFLLGTPVRAERILSDQATCSLWTVGPGPELYAAWGHSALRIQDPALGLDRIYNFGTFDFDTPNFYLKFIQGNLDYLLTTGVGLEVLEIYRDETHQLVIEQDLNLTPEEKDQLLLRLERNLQPENAAYRYDFVHDNCSTRLRDAVAAVVPLTWGQTGTEKQTLRQIVQPYVLNRPGVRNGINLLFTGAMDRLPTNEEAMFLPETMQQAFAGAVTRDGRPLIQETRVLCPGSTLPKPVFDWLPVVFWLVALGGAISAGRNWTWVRWIDLPLFMVCGLVGLFLAFLWFGTRHWVLHGNWSLLWAWPTHLLIWFFPKGFRRGYWRICAAAMFALVPALFFLPQEFPGIIPPLLLLLGFRAWSRAGL